VVLEAGPGAPASVPLSPEPGGYFSGTAERSAAGSRYRLRLDGESQTYPDPASRFQPEGPHGPSEVIDTSAFRWTDGSWRGVPPEGQIVYEMHIGTFTREGTWAAAAAELSELARAGVTVIEVMPVADFPGRFGWGYDGVDLFAPTRLYGRPEEFQGFVNTAHAHSLGVILDVVYNHLGPDGNYLKLFSEDYFTNRYENEWGEPINFDGQNSGPVREFFLANAAYWIDAYHLDGLRLDATQQTFDASPEHILAAVARTVREAAGRRSTFLVAENEPQNSRIVRPPEQGGYGLDSLWNDDFHHSAMVALTGCREGYYTDYRGAPQEFISSAKYGYLFQGQRYRWQKKRRGTPAWGLRPAQLVNYTQNHDQVANSSRGTRGHLLTSPGRWRAMTALLLLAPGTPMLFQGQEFAASSPFLYFADHHARLADKVRNGRAEFLAQFPSMGTPEMQARLHDPADPFEFERCKLDLAERERHAEWYRLHQDLIRLRRDDAVFRAQRPGGVDGAVLAAEAFLLRYFGAGGNDRLLLVNLGRDLRLEIAPEPLLAPPDGAIWRLLWSSEDPRYGGCGTPHPETEEYWRIPGHAALVLAPQPASEAHA
jgi:maltooligosyltrehalose trehalohydrolase